MQLLSVLKLAENEFQKMSINFLLIVVKERLRSIGGSEFHRYGNLLK